MFFHSRNIVHIETKFLYVFILLLSRCFLTLFPWDAFCCHIFLTPGAEESTESSYWGPWCLAERFSWLCCSICSFCKTPLFIWQVVPLPLPLKLSTAWGSSCGSSCSWGDLYQAVGGQGGCALLLASAPPLTESLLLLPWPSWHSAACCC